MTGILYALNVNSLPRHRTIESGGHTAFSLMCAGFFGFCDFEFQLSWVEFVYSSYEYLCCRISSTQDMLATKRLSNCVKSVD